LLIGTWTRQIDRARVTEVLAGRLPFDERTFSAHDSHTPTTAEIQQVIESAPVEHESAKR
jgi:aerobic C4-dicarboxylate transport protein